jgi:Leucine-rich repeat (LRR) protein
MNINTFDEYDENTTALYLTEKNITGVCDFSRFKKLEKIYCLHNQIFKIINLPDSLTLLDCSYSLKNIIYH